MNQKFLIGVDFGTDSVRALLVSSEGQVIQSSVQNYTRWANGEFCDSGENRYRQHPLDYIESLEAVLKDVLDGLSEKEKKQVKGISVDTTGSTPVAVNKKGTPLALCSGFEENPNAMFILWKDHTAVDEAGEINKLAKNRDGPDYTRFVGGVYSSEWFWAKILHTLRVDKKVRDAAYSWAEHCDWITYELTGGKDVHEMKRSRCAAGHKAMWNEQFEGLPSETFLKALDPLLGGLREKLYRSTQTSDTSAGLLSQKWADKLGLPGRVTVGVGAFDAHMGAVGGEIKPYYLSKVMGTSTCDMLVVPRSDLDDSCVHGICGQVDGSVIPGMIGLEAGQSAFGDLYAWFNSLLLWPLQVLESEEHFFNTENGKHLQQEIRTKTLEKLSEQASRLGVDPDDPVALDWLNGRRTPDANQKLTMGIEGLTLGTSAPQIFKTIVEASCFGAKAIVERFEVEGVPIKGVIGLGGVAKKSPYVMQTLATVLNRPIDIVSSEHTCALGSAMFAAVASGTHSTIENAMDAMGSGFETTYEPDQSKSEVYKVLFDRYKKLGAYEERRVERSSSKGKIGGSIE